MHIPDGYLGPATYGGLWASMAGIWSLASARVKRDLKTSQVPFLALGSAFSFVAMIFAVPLPGGTTAHICGATLIAVLIGPWAAVIAVSTALIIQALVFGDGGVTAIAANCFNIAFAGSLSGWAVYRLVTAAGEKFGRNRKYPAESASSGGDGLPAAGISIAPAPASADRPKTSIQVVAAAAGAYIGVNVAALFTALELGLQPLIHGAGPGGTGYFPYPLSVAVPAILIPHLTLVGGLEALVAGLVIAFAAKAQPGIFRGRRTGALALMVSAFVLLLLASAAHAHDFVIERKGKDFAIVFGHGAHMEDFDPAKVKSVRAIDSSGRELPVHKEKRDKALVLRIDGEPSAVLADIDNGYWSKTIYGWKELPRRKASRVVEAVRQTFHTKAILAWNDGVKGASSDAKLDISPEKDPFSMKSGDSLPVKVTLGGKPLPGAELESGDHNKAGKTGADGTISVRLAKGLNILAVDYREPIRDDPDADALTLTATLSFEVKN